MTASAHLRQDRSWLDRGLLHLPRPVRFSLWVVGLNLVLFTLLRLGFWIAFRSGAADAAPGDLLYAFYLGLKFDLQLALLICLPPLALAVLPPLNPARRMLAKRLWIGYFVLAQALALFLYLVDFGFFGYVRSRLNASLLEHLQPVSIALQVAWQTYPVLQGLLLLAALSGGYYYFLRRVASRELLRESVAPGPWTRRGALAVVLGLYAMGVYGKWSWYPLRWSDAYFSTNDFVAALAVNPILFLSDTYDNRSEGYDLKSVRRHYASLARLLEVDHPDAERLSFERFVAPNAAPAGPLNLVVIHLESFAGFKAGAFGNRLAGTPGFDALARDGILFTNFFVPAVPTARSVFTMLTGIPDVNVGRTASRNPRVVRQHTLVNALRDHERFYFLGGSATWGNIRGILQGNIPNLHVYEEGDYEAERADGWGVTDLALFDKALAVLKESKGPFFAFIQTAGNHRPYTIPDDGSGFKLASLDESTLKENGFDSLAAYNGLRYLDFALDHFFERVRQEPYFRNTLFVMYGDHGNPSASPTPWEKLSLTSFHVPFLIYAPGLIREGRRIDTPASLVDLLPTSLSLMKVPYRNTTLGRDLLSPRPAAEHFAFLPMGILNEEFLLQLGQGRPDRLYRYRSSTPTVDVRAAHPEAALELHDLREALLQTSAYLLYHNPPRPHAPDPR